MIFIHHEDVQYMLESLDLTPEVIRLLKNISVNGGEVSDDIADELRDLCNDKLDISGYDSEYKLNERGKMLDTLVDKLFVG